MDPLTFEHITRNPELVEAIVAQARRERAAAVHRLIVEPIRRLFRGHAARTHLRPSRKAGGAAA
jgi:hypothetical protein